MLDRVLQINVPFSPGASPAPEHIDLALNESQRLRLGEILDALMTNGAKLANGRRVSSPALALRYLMESAQSLPIELDPPNA